MNLGILHTGIRKDEKLLIDATTKQNINFELFDLRTQKLDPADKPGWSRFDAVLERCISTVRGNAAIKFFTNLGISTFNSKNVAAICNDKFQTSTILEEANVPVVKSVLVFDASTATKVVKELGDYPIVLKSRSGSWGRLIAKINDPEALEAVFDHKGYMGPEHAAVIVQEYIDKYNGRDIRAFVLGGEVIAAIYRKSEHWITNTARGGQTSNCKLTPELSNICKRASDAVGGGILAMDLFETENRGLIINEINHTMEFKNSEAPTGVNISGKVIEYIIKQINNENYE
ncbi:lysine biosynthesis protein LysX [Candidatus Dojkabacteria bacterium]|nr:lysine biosynthesis protein LysX [Candidatus Dojkabacteria bacterium]